MEKFKFRLIAGMFMLLFGIPSDAQELYLGWVKQMGGTYGGIGTTITVDEVGNVYVAGDFKGTVDFDPGQETTYFTSEGDYDIFIQKLDASGNLIWVKHLSGPDTNLGRSIAVDNLGNIYITGEFKGNVDFDPGPDNLTLNSAGEFDIFIQKLDALGNLIWVKQMGGNAHDYGESIKVDNLGNIYTTGNFTGIVDFDPGPGVLTFDAGFDDNIYIQKLDSAGDLIWAKQIGGWDYEKSNAIEIDVLGNVYTTGFFRETVDFDPGPGTYFLSASGGEYDEDIFIHKLDQAGNFVWAKQISGTSDDSGNSISIDEDSNIYVTGTFRQTADFDPGPDTFNLSVVGTWDIFVQKLDALGNLIWVKQMGGPGWDIGTSILFDDTGNVYTTGLFQGTVDFDPGLDTLYLTSAGERDIFIQKLDASGNFQLVHQIGGIYNENVSSTIDHIGNIYSTGSFKGEVDFDPGSDTFILNSVGETHDIFVIKMKTCNSSTSISTDEDTQICEGEIVTLTANGGENYLWSTGDTTAMIFVSPLTTTNFTLEILDSLGCFSYESIQITVEPLPYAQFDYSVNETTVVFTNLSSSIGTNFQWDFGDNSPQSMDENPVHEYSQPGVYLVTLVATNEFCGGAITQIVNVLSTGNHNIENDTLVEIFPNPASDVLTIKSDVIIETIQIANILGQRVLEINDSDNIKEVGLGSLSPGVYVITLFSEDQMWSMEFIKK